MKLRRISLKTIKPLVLPKKTKDKADRNDKDNAGFEDGIQ